ncbi:MAG: response regulator [Pseudomonadota bacterium]
MTQSTQLDQTIFVVDDDPAVRESLVFLLETVDLRARAHDSAQAFLDGYGGESGVLILDVRMPGMSGIELQELLNERGVPELAIIFISGHGDIPMAVEALKRGAADFLTKPFRDQDLLDRIHQALEENEAGHEVVLEKTEIEQRVESLTARERQVMERVADGQANKVVALDLGISQRTVEIHRTHVMEKMGVRTLAHLVRSLHRIGHFDGAPAVKKT